MMLPVKANGRYYDHTNFRASGLPGGFDNTLFTAHLQSVSWSEEITPTLNRGVHGIPLPRGRGFYVCTTSLEVAFEAWDSFTRNMAANGLDGFSDFDFDLKIQLITRGRPVTEVIWHEASLLGPGTDSASGGSNTLTSKIKVYTRYITTNGVCAYPLDLDQGGGIAPALAAAISGITGT